MFSSCRRMVIGKVWVTVVAAVSTWGCGGGSNQPMNTDPQCDVPKLLEERCAIEGCHTPTAPEGTINFAAVGLEERVANVSGVQCLGILADPADPTGSIIYEKVSGTSMCGQRMPPMGFQQLNDDELRCVRNWISGLLPPSPVDAGGSDSMEICAVGETRPCYTGPEGTEDEGICRGGIQSCGPGGLSWNECEEELTPRAEDCFTADMDENCDGLTPECREEWSLGFGNEQAQSFRSAGVDASGNVFAVGDFEGRVSFGGDRLTADGTKYDLVLAKYDHFGNHVWSKKFGDTSNQYATQLGVDGDGNVVIIGRAFGTVNFGGTLLDGVGTDDLFVAKFDNNGEHVWSKMLGGTDPERGERIAFDSQGNVYVTAAYNEGANFGSGALSSQGLRDAILVKLNADTGSTMYVKTVGGVADDYGFGVDVDTEGNVYFAGRFGDSVTIGSQIFTSEGGIDMFLVKYNPSGVVQWVKTIGSDGDDASYDVRIDRRNNDVVLIGYISGRVQAGGAPVDSAGSRDLFLAKFTTDGDHVFSYAYGDEDDQFEASTFEDNTWAALELDSQGNIFIGGPIAYSMNVDGGSIVSAGKLDMFYVKLSPNADYITGRRFGTIGTDIGLDIALAGDDYLLLAGRTYSSGTLSFGDSGVIDGQGSSDAVLVKLRVP